jgi:3-oxoacyl-[acyl-carrier-protein] synthase-3
VPARSGGGTGPTVEHSPQEDELKIEDTFLSGLGIYLPSSVSIEHAIEEGWYDIEDAEKTELTGVAVADGLSGPEMAVEAAREALSRAGCEPATVDLLLYVDVYYAGPDGWLPQSYVQRHVVGSDALAVGVRQGCNGLFGALELAVGYLRAEVGRSKALIVTADNLSSPLLDRWRCTPGTIVGDAASAVLLTTTPGFARLCSVASASIPELEQLHRGNEPLYPAGITMGRRLQFQSRFDEFIQNGGFGLDGQLVFVKTMVEVAHRVLDEAGIGVQDLARVVTNNGAREGVRSRLDALGLPMELSTWELGRGIGHVGASDQLVSLDRLLADGQLAAGSYVLFLGLGPGVSMAAAVVEILEAPPWTH